MPLHFATEPRNGAPLVHEGLNRLSRRRSPLSERGIDFGALVVSGPLAVWDLRADAVARGGGLESAVFTGFRYLVEGGGGVPVAAAEVQVDTTGTATVLANINYGQFVGATERALRKVAELRPVTEGSYEVQFLRCAPIAVVALWLKSDSDGADFVYPLEPAPVGLQAENPYSAGDFVQAILPLARRRVTGIGETTLS